MTTTTKEETRLTGKLQMCIYTNIWNWTSQDCLFGKDHISIYGHWSIFMQWGLEEKSILILKNNTMQIKQHLATASKYAGKNTLEYIVLHHTGTKEGTIKGNLNHLTTSGKASCHYVVDTNGDLYKIGDDTDILWHAGEVNWPKKDKWGSLNAFSIWIEIIGPLSDGGFTDAQRATVASLVQELCAKYKIPQDKILRHKDISWYRGKWDVSDTFWSWKYKSFDEYRKSLFPTTPTMPKSRYTEIMENILKETGFEPVFSTHDGDKPCTEQETRELIEIGLARLFQRLTKKQ